MTFTELKNRILSFKKLKKGWDSYDGKRIEKKVVDKALQINEMILQMEEDLINVTVSPCGDGSILFELETDDTFISICVGAED